MAKAESNTELAQVLPKRGIHYTNVVKAESNTELAQVLPRRSIHYANITQNSDFPCFFRRLFSKKIKKGVSLPPN